MFEKKIEKNTNPCGILHEIDPAKHDIERLIIELAMLNFRPRVERALPAHARSMGLIVPSLLGTVQHPGFTLGSSPLPLVFGDYPSEGLVTLTPGLGLGPTHLGGPQTRGEGGWIPG